MLFSHDDIATFINDNFESTWQNVREVPMVTIDFGGGNVLTRTLNGNIATYVCNSDGVVLDVLPGIYEPRTYKKQLTEFFKLHQWIGQQKLSLGESLANYHRQQAEALAKGNPPLEFKAPLSVTKYRIEKITKLVLMAPQKVDGDHTTKNAGPHELAPSEDVARWNELADDTRVNETVRRLAIHKHLVAQSQPAQPSHLTKWLYREILNADLDDPYLGLGKILFANYPFKDKP